MNKNINPAGVQKAGAGHLDIISLKKILFKQVRLLSGSTYLYEVSLKPSFKAPSNGKFFFGGGGLSLGSHPTPMVHTT